MPRSSGSTPEAPRLRCRVVGGRLLHAGALRVAVQRVPLAVWSATVAPRSWGLVPLHRMRQVIQLPCADDEAVWIGAWLEAPGAGDTDEFEMSLCDESGAVLARTTRAAGGALFRLGEPPGAQPIRRQAHLESRYRLVLRHGPARAQLRLRLIAPAAWAQASGRAAPGLALAPPPVPRLDTHPPRRRHP